MSVSLPNLIENNLEWLVDEVAKDAIRQIPSYGRAPIKLTMARMERLLKILAESVRRNNPNIMEQFLEGVAVERHERAYPIGELHAILDSAEGHLCDLAKRSTPDKVDRNAQLALIGAIMDSARMVFSKAYLLIAAGST